MKTIDLQPDEYLGEDGLAYCKNCHTPRVCRIEDRYFPINCKCQREAYEKAEYERKLQERKAKAEEYRRFTERLIVSIIVVQKNTLHPPPRTK